MLVRQIATKLSVKRGERYSDVRWYFLSFLKARIRGILIKACISIFTQR